MGKLKHYKSIWLNLDVYVDANQTVHIQPYTVAVSPDFPQACLV